MKYSLLILVFICSMCNKRTSFSEKFEGRFHGNTNNIISSADITVSDERLRGTVVMNGQRARLDGEIDDKGAWGSLYDEVTGKEYEYECKIKDDVLTMAITFPELDDRVIELTMQKEGGRSKVKKQSGTGKHDPAIVGTWRHTEILGGGDGMSMTNESMMEFAEDGTCSSWPGRSSGPDYYRDEDKSRTSHGKWYTKGDLLYFVDPATGEEASTNYSVNESGLLMSNGGAQKKKWERVR